MKTKIKNHLTILRSFALAVLVIALAMAGCKKKDTKPVEPPTPAFVAVTDITSVPTAAMVGTALTLTGTVAPATATNKTITWSAASGTTGASISDGNKLITTAAGTAVVTATIANGATATTPYTKEFTITVTLNPEVTDAGVVIGGVTWATRNVGAFGKFAAKPEDVGMYYQWNRKIGWPATGTVTGWDATESTSTVWETANDPCPYGWHIPDKAQIDALIASGSVWGPYNGIAGRTYGTGMNVIFLPAAGTRARSDGAITQFGTYGDYWRNTNAGGLSFNSLSSNSGVTYWKAAGLCIRCVKD